MKNREKYTEEIKNYKGSNFCSDFVRPKILKTKDCATMPCNQCRLMQLLWLDEEYEEPEVDWSKVPVNTKILVRDGEDDPWRRRYFAKYEDGNIHAFINGFTSWSSVGCTLTWRFAKLLEEGADE